ncbi:hypothetical protein DAPPUDRAFT_249829 [Daphnia pulex]|uniref:Uncharacterized protein n=1 Tax=Daphnia pulex TaxID=6669 RepID=E9GXC9_DAPPU|nr:hypothetical protein DAPPUDRAFT_249829 [Daphnia pulex]|eukprot:EFX75847.1 hypothetical protein DAPPUDRAFT_249829 [Daphnia pulex]
MDHSARNLQEARSEDQQALSAPQFGQSAYKYTEKYIARTAAEQPARNGTAKNLRGREPENVEPCHNEVLAECVTEEEFNKEFCWFESFPDAHRKMLAEMNAYLGEGQSKVSSQCHRCDRCGCQELQDQEFQHGRWKKKIQEKARKVADKKLRMKNAKEEARFREKDEETIWRLDEEKQKERVKG